MRKRRNEREENELELRKENKQKKRGRLLQKSWTLRDNARDKSNDGVEKTRKL